MDPFHLAFPVTDLEATRRFYVDVLGCGTGREDTRWIDFDLGGHQITAHLVDAPEPGAATNPVDGEDVPVRHFGLVVSVHTWERMVRRVEKAGVPFLIAPTTRFAGEVGEQRTFFVRDPGGNAVELKAFAEPTRLFARPGHDDDVPRGTYERTYEVRWSDLDPNRHLRASVYSDYGAQTRFAYLAEHGFSPERFAELEFGPIVLRETTEYLREVGMGERITVGFQVTRMRGRGFRWAVRHEIRRRDGETAAIIDLDGGWMDLKRRRLRRPPDDLVATLRYLEPAGLGDD